MFAYLLLLAGVAHADSTLPIDSRPGTPFPGCIGKPAAEEPLYAEGLAAMARGGLADARRHWLQLIKEKPASPFVPDVYLRFGDYYFEQAQLDTATQFYRKVLLMAPTCASYAHYKLAWTAFQQADYKEALAEFARVLQDGSGTPARLKDSRHGLVLAFARAGHPQKARAFFNRVAPAYVDQMLAELREASR